MTHSLKWGKRLTAAAGVTALVAAGFAGTSFAADLPSGVVADLDSVSSVSLSIYKHEGDPTATGTEANSNDGLAKTMPEGDKPMKDVVFSATPVQCAYDSATKADVDLSTNAGWQMIKNLSLSVSNGTVTLTGGTVDGKNVNCSENTAAAVTATTGENGWTGAWSGTLAKTVYVVREKSAPAKPAITAKVQPFLVTLPLAYKDGGWIGDVKVYAKNQTSTDESTKTPGEMTQAVYEVTQATSDTDSKPKTTSNPAELTWTLSSVLPVQEGAYTKFVAVDKLPAGIVYKDASVTVTRRSGTAESTVAGAWGLTTVGCKTGVACVFSGEGANATAAVAYNDKTGTDSNWDAASASLQFTLTGPINTLQSGDKVVITLKTAVDPTKLGTGVLTAENKYSFTVNDDPNTTTEVDKPEGDCPEGQTCTPTINFGKIAVTKVNAKKADVKLAGAQFELYVVQDDKNAATGTVVDSTGTKVDLAQVGETYTTAAGGVLELTVPLPNGSTPAATTYYLKEIKAPKGYELPTGTDVYTKVEFDSAKTVSVSIKNTQTTITTIPGGLPITGAQGLMLLTLGGAAIVLVGVGSVMVIRRRQEQD